MTDIEIIRRELDDVKERLDKLEAQFSWPTSLSSDWNYVKDHLWDESPFEWTNYTQDTAVSKKNI